MKLHVDHRTVFETEHGVLARQVAYFERAEDAQEYVKLEADAVRLRAIFDKFKERVAALWIGCPEGSTHWGYNEAIRSVQVFLKYADDEIAQAALRPDEQSAANAHSIRCAGYRGSTEPWDKTTCDCELQDDEQPAAK